MARSNRFLRSKAEADRHVATAIVRTAKGSGTFALLLCAAFAANSQEMQADAEVASAPDVTELDAVEVTARRPQDLYRSKPVERTPPTVFERDWREPVNLRQIGMEGGVVPLLMRYLAKEAPKAAEKYIPGWRPQIQPAIARPPPLDEAQLQRAADLQDSP